MDRRISNLLLIIAIVIIVALIDFPILSEIKNDIFNRNLSPVLGLDLRGGMQVILQVPEGYTIDQESLAVAARILENRANALGVSEVVFQVTGQNYIVGEFPGLQNTEEVIKVIKQTGLLEIVDIGTDQLEEGSIIKTDYQGTVSSDSTEEQTLDKGSLSTITPDLLATPQPQDKVYHTLLTGGSISNVAIGAPTTTNSGYSVQIVFNKEGAEIFSDYTKNNIGKMVAIVLDKKVISTPVIRSHIPDGQGVISGQYPNVFTYDEANNLKVTIHYGSLPVALEIAESRIVGPTLGQLSLEKSLLAGVIGLAIVSLFMILYYRLPGLVAVITITIFGLISYAIFLIIPVTLTLPGIAGFLLSIGSALDANILQFERFKEELRKGRNLVQAVDIGWKRAWTSIRDSNLATIITSAILFWFGSTFGATLVKGFALTLALGVLVSLFTAVFVTRSLLAVVLDYVKTERIQKWFGL